MSPEEAANEVCPFEHVIHRNDGISFYDNASIFTIECNGKSIATRSFDVMEISGRTQQRWADAVIKDHLIEYLQGRIRELKKDATELRAEITDLVNNPIQKELDADK